MTNDEQPTIQSICIGLAFKYLIACNRPIAAKILQDKMSLNNSMKYEYLNIATKWLAGK